MLCNAECKVCRDEFNLSYFNKLVSEFYLLTPADQERNPAAFRVINEIVDNANNTGTVTCDDVYNFEKSLVKLQPIQQLKLEISSLRDKYKSLAGQKRYGAYLNDAGKESGEEAVRADIEYLLGELQLIYTLMPAREKLRGRLIRKVAGITAGYLSAFTLLALVLRHFNGVEIFPLVLVITFGSIGGFISMIRRLQSVPSYNDPTANFLELKYGQTSVILAPINGAIFAVVMMMLFAGGLLKNDLFPLINNIRNPLDYFVNVSLTDTTEFAKLLIWSFIAGFAERLVPDTLDRIVARKQKDEGVKTKAVPGVSREG